MGREERERDRERDDRVGKQPDRGGERDRDRDRERKDRVGTHSAEERGGHRERTARATSPVSTDAASSSDEGSSDEERRRRDRKKRKAKEKGKKSHKHKSHKSKDEHRQTRDEKKKKHKRRLSSDESDESDDSDDRKRRRLLKEAKKVLKKHKSENKIVPMEPAPIGLKVDNISEEHYFEKSNEFAMWLKEAKGLFFSSLSSEETHKLFTKFVEIWNAGKLSAKYYQGIKAAPRTAHKWGIKLNRNENVVLGKDEDDLVQEKKWMNMERKKFNKQQEVVMDELIPKATGREAMLEKKALRREEARAREDSPENFKEKDVMGGGDDFQQRLARERQWRERKASAKSEVYMEKRSAFEEKEAAAMNQFKALVDMSGGKMTIPKRNV